MLAFIATAVGIVVPWWVWVAVVAAGFFVASWRAYDEVLLERVALRAELDQVGSSRDESVHRKAVRDQVARFLADGEKLYPQIWDDASPNYGSSRFLAITYSDRDWAPEFHGWVSEVATYLRQELGQSYVDVFLSTSGLAKPPHQGGFMLSPEHAPILNSLSWCLQRLEQLVRELPNA